jgi:hypothetical protein
LCVPVLFGSYRVTSGGAVVGADSDDRDDDRPQFADDRAMEAGIHAKRASYADATPHLDAIEI